MSTRTRRDADVKVTKALPAAAANNNSSGIDLGSVTPGVLGEKIEVILEVPALPSLVDAKTVIYTLQDSADGVTFVAIPELATLTVTGAGGVGCAAATRTVRLPSSVRRYVGFNQAVLAAGGDNTAKSATLSLLV
jgi:hypothetical protein